MAPKRKSKGQGRCRFIEEWGIQYFFVQSGDQSLCLICNTTLPGFEEGKLRHHYRTQHEAIYSQFTGEQRAQKFEELQQSARPQENESSIMANYKVAYALAKEGKPSTYGEVIKGCLMGVVAELCPEKMNLIKNISLEPDTIAHRIENISDNIVKQMAEKASHFQQYSIALDESDSKLLVFIRGVDSDFNVTQELASVQSMSGTVTGEDIFNYLQKTLLEYRLEWNNLKCVTIGEGRNISGVKRGLVEQITNTAEVGGFSEPMVLQCAIHQLALCGEHVDILCVLEPVVVIVNHIRSHGRNHCQFHELLKETDSVDLPVITFAEFPEYADYIAVRWLNYGKVLSQFFQLREEIKSFLEENQPQPLLSKTDWLWRLAFFVDLIDHMNQLRLKLQGETNLAINVFSHVIAFRAELIQFERELQSQNLDHFPFAAKFHEESQAEFPSFFVEDIIANLQEQFPDFDGIADEIKMLQTPFDCDEDRCPVQCQREIIVLQSHIGLKSKYRRKDLFQFYNSLQSAKFLNLKQLACGYLSIFGTCLFEETFSKKYLQSQNRANLSEASLKSMLIIGSSSLQPQFDKIFQLNDQLPSGSASR